MPPSALRPVFTALRLGLHVLVVGLTLFVVVRALLADGGDQVGTTVLAVAFLACYGAGVAAAHRLPTVGARGVARRAARPLGRPVGAHSRCGVPRVPPLLPRAARAARALRRAARRADLHPQRVGHRDAPRLRGRQHRRPLHRGGRRDHHRPRVPRHGRGVPRAAGAHPRPARDARGARRGESRGGHPRRARAPRPRDPRHRRPGALEHPDAAARRRARRRPTADARQAAARARDRRGESRRDPPVHPRAHPARPRLADAARRAPPARRGDERAGRSSPGSRAASISFTTSGEPVLLPMAIEATLLRIAQGSLANVLQHADAARAGAHAQLPGRRGRPRRRRRRRRIRPGRHRCAHAAAIGASGCAPSGSGSSSLGGTARRRVGTGRGHRAVRAHPGGGRHDPPAAQPTTTPSCEPASARCSRRSPTSRWSPRPPPPRTPCGSPPAADVDLVLMDLQFPGRAAGRRGDPPHPLDPPARRTCSCSPTTTPTPTSSAPSRPARAATC